ncbi:MAG: HD domain-containing protein [Gemmataceae bacterium]
MTDVRLRHAIALAAARLMYERLESEYYTAKRKAAKRLCGRNVKPKDLPSNAEIREQIQALARMHEGDKRLDNLKQMRLEALRLMRLLARFRPRLIGSVMTGHIRKGSDIDLHVFSDSIGLITDILEQHGFQYDVERKEINKFNETRVFTHIHVFDRFNSELTVYAEDKAHYVFRSSITGKAIERASIKELEHMLGTEYPELDLDAELDAEAERMDPYAYFRMLMAPLEDVKQDARYHPEGDVLYHSLQVFELAKDALPYDEEFLIAALLHDVGKGIDRSDHVNSGLEVLEGYVTDRTEFFIRHHMDAHLYRTGELGMSMKKRLASSPDFDELMLLSECDKGGRVPGAIVGTLDEALDYLRELEQYNEE